MENCPYLLSRFPHCQHPLYPENIYQPFCISYQMTFNTDCYTYQSLLGESTYHFRFSQDIVYNISSYTRNSYVFQSLRHCQYMMKTDRKPVDK